MPKASARTRVFISYSRKDLVFAQKLVESLNKEGLNAFIDKIDIAPGEHWKNRLSQLILQSDVVCFVMTPSSISSEICSWEIKEATRLNKKILPILHKDVGNAAPAELAQLNYIFFDEDRKYSASMKELVLAIQDNIEWAREHTRIGELASRWDEGRRRSSEMLRGASLDAAELWLARRPPGASPPTVLQQDFVAASRKATSQRQRLWISISSLVAAVSISLSVWAIHNRNIAREQTEEAKSQRTLALAQKAVADEQTVLAEARRRQALQEEQLAKQQRDQALLAQSSYLANLSKQKLDEDDATDAALLALEGLPDQQVSRPYLPAAESALFRALRSKMESRIDTSHQNKVYSIFALDHDAGFVTVSFDDFKIWSGALDRQVFSMKRSRPGWTWPADSVVAAALSADQSIAVTSTLSGRIDVIDLTTNAVRSSFDTGHRTLRAADDNATLGIDVPIQLSVKFGQFRNPIFHQGLVLSPNHRIVAKTDEDEAGLCLRLYDIETGKKLFEYDPGAFFAFTDAVKFSPDGQKLFWPYFGGGVLIDVASATVVRKIDLPASRYLDKMPSDQQKVENLASITQFVQKNYIVGDAFSEDGSRFYYVTRDGRFVALNLANMSDEANASISKSLLQFADFSNRAAFFATATRDGRCSLWTVRPQLSSTDVPDCGEDLRSLQVGEEGRYVVAASRNKGIAFWDTGPSSAPFDHPNKIATFRDGSSSFISAAAFGDGFAVTGGDEGHLLLWPIKNPLDPLTLFDSRDRVIGPASRIQLSGDGRRVLVSTGNEASLWERSSGKLIATLNGHYSLLRTASFDPSGTRILTASYDNTVRVWNGIDGTLVDDFGEPDKTLPPATESFNSPFRPELGLMGQPELIGPSEQWAKEFQRIELAIFSPDGRKILAADARGAALLWEPGKGYKTLDVTDIPGYGSVFGNTTWVTAAAFSPDGRQVVTGAYNGTLQLWDATTGEPLSRLANGTKEPRDTLMGNTVVSRIVYVTSTRILVGIGGGVGTSDAGHKLRAYDIDNAGKIVGRLDFGFDGDGLPLGPTGHEGQNVGAVLDIAVSPDRKLVATGGEDLSVRLWDASSGRQLALYLGSSESVRKIRFSNDGRRLVISPGGGLVTILDVPSLKVASFVPTYDSVADFDMSENGQSLAVVSQNGARIWPIFNRTEDMVTFAQVHLTRCLGPFRRLDYALDRTPPAWCHARKKFPYRRIMIGLPLMPLTPADKSRLGIDHGALADSAPTLTPAWLAGIEKDDIILKVGNIDVKSPSDVVAAVSNSTIFRPIKFQIWRRGKIIAFDVTPGGEKMN